MSRANLRAPSLKHFAIYVSVASEYFGHLVNYFGIINKYTLIYVTKATYIEICRNNCQLLAQMYTVTVDKEKISHLNYSRDFFNTLFNNVVIEIK